MVERLGVAGDAGGFDGLVFFLLPLGTLHTLTFRSLFFFFLSPQVNASITCIHPLIRLAQRIR